MYVFSDMSPRYALPENMVRSQAGEKDVSYHKALMLMSIFAFGCATPTSPLDDYEELDAETILDAPTPAARTVAPENRASVAHGEYLVELLGCGTCHTDGALIGEPRSDRALAGSSVGIAYTNPLEIKYPGVVFAPNITPDKETGIGAWTDRQIAAAIKSGIGRHGSKPIVVMPWQSFARLTAADVNAIVGYLRHIEPVTHRVPDSVRPGQRSRERYVHFGVYRSR